MMGRIRDVSAIVIPEIFRGLIDFSFKLAQNTPLFFISLALVLVVEILINTYIRKNAMKKQDN